MFWMHEPEGLKHTNEIGSHGRKVGLKKFRIPISLEWNEIAFAHQNKSLIQHAHGIPDYYQFGEY